MAKPLVTHDSFSVVRRGYQGFGRFLVWGGPIFALYALILGVIVAAEGGPWIVVAVSLMVVPLGLRLRRHGLLITADRVQMVTMFRTVDIPSTDVADVTLEPYFPFMEAPTLDLREGRPIRLRMLGVDRRQPLGHRNAANWVGEIRRVLFGLPVVDEPVPPLTRQGTAMVAIGMAIVLVASGFIFFRDGLGTDWIIGLWIVYGLGATLTQWASRNRRGDG